MASGMSTENATVFITGASRGIGAATARRLHARRARVGLIARSQEELEALAAELGDRVAVAVADVGDRNTVESAIDRLSEELGAADVLVNNAGLGAYAAVIEEDPDVFERLMRVNYLGTVYATRAVLSSMARRRRGMIINVASVAGRIGAPFEAAYSASKFAVVGFSESLAAEMGELGIQVRLIDPGPVRTGFTDARGVPFQRDVPRPLDPERVVDAIVTAIESGRFEQVLPRWLRIAEITRVLLPGPYRAGVARDSRAESAALAARVSGQATP